MATGVTSNKWQEDTHIVTDEAFKGGVKYELLYEGKAAESEIVDFISKNEFVQLLEAKQDNQLYYGDNFDVLSHLIHDKKMRGKVKLVYIDPPYGTNSIFQSRHQKDSYKDDLVGGHFIEFIRRRLILIREILADDGSIYLHLDGNMTFQIKVIMDEVFGPKNFRGFVTRKKCSNKNSTRKTYGNISDYIIFYSKSDNYIWHRATDAWTEEKILKEYPCIDEKSGRRYKKVPIHAPGVRNGETGKEWKGMFPPSGKHWQYTPERLDDFEAKGEIYWSPNGNPRRKVFLDSDSGIPVQDIWLDVQDSLNQNIRITGYPTEKNPQLLERIIKASSNKGDIVLDCFAGSGTTLDIAEQLERNWIGVDNSSEAIRNIIKRFYVGLEGMGDFVKNNHKAEASNQSKLFDPKVQYKTKLSGRKNFNFYTDVRFKEIMQDLIDEHENI